jgi:hypothetical protein
MVRIMDPDEQLYEAAAKELASSPRTGLLAKCMAKCGNDENKGKARYIEVRVGEMKKSTRLEAMEAKKEQIEDQLDIGKMSNSNLLTFFVVLILAALLVGVLLFSAIS